MTIELSDAQREELVALLTSAISDLGMEIAETERLDFRNGLKDRRQHLRQVLDRLQPKAETERA